ncbi:hemagglutinin [Mycoplasmopsis synoviae]|nr:hemagglutinin [Mycoplasmopsis synoviae]
MPKIVVEDYQSAGDGSNKEANKTANQKKLEAWFGDAANWAGLEDQLTKRLGSDKFKNVKLTYASVTLTDFTAGRGVTRWYPTVKFRVEANEGYTLDTNSTREIDIVVRVLYKSAEANADNVFTHEGASPSAAPRGATVNDANVKANVNVYLNYTGPSIVLDEAHPTVGATPNTSINGTSNVTGEFNTKFKKLLVSVFRQGHAESSLFQAVINYVNKFDPKFRAQFVTDSKNGVALTSVQNGTQLRIGSLNDFLYNNKGFLQQVNGDSSAVYFAVNGVTSEGWLNTFLIRIPLTKFVRPITPFTASAVMIPTTEDYQEDSSNAGNTNENTETPVEDQTGQESSESGSTQTDQAQQESPQTQ